MPLRWHWLRLRTTCHPTESLDRVRTALRNCTGLDEETFAPLVTETRLEAHHGGEVVLLGVEVSRAKEIRAVLEQVPEADKAELLAELEPRTDDDGVFHFRFGKQDAFEGNVHVTRGEDAVQASLKPEVHPRSREAAMAAVRSWLEGAR